MVFKQASMMVFAPVEFSLSIAKDQTATWSEAQGELLPHKGG